MKADRILRTDVKRLMIGSAAGILCFLGGTVIFALILMKNDLDYSTIKYFCFAATAVSALTAGFIGKKRNKQKGIVCGLFAAIPLLMLEYIVLLSINHFHPGEETILLLPAGLLFGMIGGIISSNMR